MRNGRYIIVLVRLRNMSLDFAKKFGAFRSVLRLIPVLLLTLLVGANIYFNFRLTAKVEKLRGDMEYLVGHGKQEYYDTAKKSKVDNPPTGLYSETLSTRKYMTDLVKGLEDDLKSICIMTNARCR